MTAESLQDRIISTLKEGHYPTCDQLLALLNTSDDVRALKLGKPRLLQILRSMRTSGLIDQRTDRRYYVHVGRYSWRCDDSLGFYIERLQPDGIPMIIGNFMTEAEARVCVTALNELDRKVRAIKNR
jgi:hypothetical protein